MSLKIITFGLVIVLLMTSTNVFAQNVKEINFGPSLQILDAQKRGIPNEPILNDNELSFKLTFTNELSYWVCWKKLDYVLKITKVGDSNNYNIQQLFEGEECLPPNTEKIFWIPFKSYNEMGEEERMGKWRIEPSASLKNTECYQIDLAKKESCENSPSFSGNIREFEVVKEEPTIHTTNDDIRKWLKSGYNIFYAGLGLFALLISVILGIKKLFGK